VSRYGPVELLTADHETAEFDCGSPAQTTWLRRFALQAQQAGTSRVYVVCRRDAQQVVGYHAIASGTVAQDDASTRVRKGTGRYPIPVVLLTRMGVDVREQGYGLGKALVADAMRRTLSVAGAIGVRALLVHAETEEAREFYQHLAEFEQSPTDPLHLMLLVKDLKG
jgi:GNAT superfamily N-acetyltransferase